MRTLFALALFMLSANVIAADINGDGAVDRADLDIMRAAFYGYDARADLNGDGKVNFADLALLKGAMSGGSAAAVPLVAPNVTLLPATQDVGPNGTLVLDMFMDFTEEPTLGGGVDTTFDPAVLNFVSFVFDPALGDDPSFRRQPNLESPGVLNALAFGNFDGLSGPSRVGTFTFSVNTVLGPTPITIAADQADGVAGPFVSIITFLPMNVVFNSAQGNVRGAEITVTPSPVNLGSVRQGQTEQVAVTVSNSGLATLTTGVVGSTDPIAPPFAIAGNACNNRNLAPAASCTLNVRLTGSGTPGARNDSFNVPSNATNNPNVIVPTTGNIVQRVSVQPIQGITTTTASCTNQTTGQTVNINLAGATSLNCETAGLSPLAPGSVVVIQINGTRSAGPMVGGTVRSMGLTLVQCQNLTTGQNRNFDPAPPGPAPRNWNCLGGGWTAAPGNSVRMTVRGAAD
jgi:hypothetical protein